jgi:hypothetical protein
VTRLDDIVDAAWAAYREAIRARFGPLVLPSIPIAWFGDLDAYLRSPLRVITVGLNPSRREFPDTDRFQRFPQASHIDGNGFDAADRPVYVQALSDYFRERPYSDWFRPSFKELLVGMGVSFCGEAPNTALHTDLCSPLATDPTWGKLGPQRELLRGSGVRLWHNLAGFLAPDVIVVSVRRSYLEEISFAPAGPPRVIFTIDRKAPYTVEVRDMVVSSERRTTLVFGRAAQKPFGTVDATDKRRIGATILEYRAR